MTRIFFGAIRSRKPVRYFALLAIFVLGALELLAPRTSAQESRDDIAIAPLDRKLLKTDRVEFSLRHPARTDDTPGILKNAGYVGRPVRLERASFRSSTGDATVEVVKHPGNYKFVRHDLIGTFKHFAGDGEAGKVGDGNRKPLQIGSWFDSDQGQNGIVCIVMKEKAGVYNGLVGWHARENEQKVTVVIRFGTRAGVPKNIVDSYLKDYPSDVARGDLVFEEWETEEGQKWTELLRANRDDVRMLQAGAAYLMRYDRRAFGLLDALKERDDAAAFAQTMEEVQQRMLQWIGEHQGVRGSRAAKPGIGDDTGLVPKTDRASFQRDGAPTEEDHAGLLGQVGSYVQGAHLQREAYVSVRGNARVEVVTFPKGYAFAAHDLFGALSGAAGWKGRTMVGDLDAPPNYVRCMDWHFEGGTEGGKVCYLQSPRSKNVFLGWFKGSPEEGVVTVVIMHDDGGKGRIPGQVVERFLREYPSDVREDPRWHIDWDIKDVTKWMGVLGSVRTSLDREANLRSRLLKEAEKGAREVEKWRELGKIDSENRKMLELGTLYLERYDHGAFGLLEAVYMRSDGTTAAFLEALDEVSEQMGRWVEQRKKAREADRRGE